MKLRKAILAVCAAVMLAASCGAYAAEAPRAVRAQSVQLHRSGSVAAEYVVGELFEFPAAPVFEYGGKSYTAEMTLRDPDGRGYTSEVVLERPGRYTLQYKAVADNGTLLLETDEFDCLSALYSLNGSKSTLGYGAFSDYPDAEEGITVELANGEELMFNKVIDLSEYPNDWKTSAAFRQVFGFYVAPKAQYSPDARQLNIKFTDAHDPENYVTVTVKKVTPAEEGAAWASINSYLTAGAAFQPAVGLERSGSGAFVWEDGQTYNIQKNSAYGASIGFSMTGGHVSTGVTVGKEKLSIGWDYAGRRVYMQEEKNGDLNKRIISDLDDIALYSELWEGFTTGEVYVSISASNYLASSFRIVITDFAGVTKEEMRKNGFREDVAPDLTVDMGGYDAPPAAIVGETYPVFPASATDLTDGETEVDVTVWKNYGSGAATMVSVENGRFMASKETVYTILYRAVDKMGNVASRTVEVPARSDILPVSATLGEKTVTGKTGEAVSVAGISISDGTGNTYWSAAAYLKGNESVFYEVDQDTLTFFPMVGGEYFVVYTYGDHLGSHTLSYDVTIGVSDVPYIDEAVLLPRLLIKNGIYEFPAKTGYVFGEDGVEEKECTLFVQQDDGALTATDGTVKITADEKVRLCYQLGSETGLYRRIYELDVVDVGLGVENGLDLTRYFIGEGFTAASGNNNVSYVTSGRYGESVSLEFVKTLLAEKFVFMFGTENEYRSFDTVRVTITDSVDDQIAVSFVFMRKNNGEAVFLLNGTGVEYPLGQSFFSETGSDFRIGYDSQALSAVLSGEISVRIARDVHGNAFSGFPSNFVYLSVELDGIAYSQRDNAAIRILRVNNQSFSSIKNDIIEPEITANTMRGEMTKGTYVQISPTYAADVLDPYVSMTMRVRDPDGEIVTAADGTVLENCDSTVAYIILLEKFGNYTVEYSVEDTSGWQTPYSYVIKVADSESPVIVIGEKVTEGSFGDTIAVADASATDSVDGEVAIEKYILTPSGRIIALSQNNGEDVYNAFVAKERGIYNVYYYAFDQAGNYAIAYYEVRIT